MKMSIRLLLSLFFAGSIISIKSQNVVFCPPGAEWRYSYVEPHFDTPTFFANEKMKYVRDSVIGTDTVKVIQHKRFIVSANYELYGPSLIKLKGDTVFIRNMMTNHTWQILYNFNAHVGEGWVTHWSKISFNQLFFVDSVQYVNIQGHTLKQLVSSTGYKVTEKIGGPLGFVLPWSSPYDDGDMLNTFLCYSDLYTGTIQFTKLPCNFEGYNGFTERSLKHSISFFPNPAATSIQVHVEDDDIGHLTLLFSDMQGRCIERFIIQSTGDQTVTLPEMSNGIYQISVLQNNRCLVTEKLAVIR